MILEFSPHIHSDIAEIVEYYGGIAGPELADEFCGELWRYFERALQFPLAYQVHSRGLRRVDLRRFPFHFWFRVIPPETVRVLVIRHHQRRPLEHAEAESLSQVGSEGKALKFVPVQSRMILGVRYNAKTREMDVVFRTGEKYRYKRVPPVIYDDLMSADSHGQYMQKRVLGHYEYERLD